MAKLTRYSSQVNAPIQKPAYMGQVGVSNASAVGLAQVGRGLTSLGGMMQDERNLRTAMQLKYQQHLDSLRSTEVNDLANISKIKIDAIYENEPDPEKWEPMIQKELSAFRKQAEMKMGSVSSERREFLEKALENFAETESIKMESIRLKQMSELNKASLAATLENAVATGNEELTATVSAEMDSQWNDWFGREALYQEFKRDIFTRGQVQYRQAEIERDKETIASVVQDGAFTDTNGEIDEQSIRSMVNSLTDDATERESYFTYAVNAAKSQLVEDSKAKQRAVDSIKPMIKETLQNSATWKIEKRFTKDDRRAAYQMVSEQLQSLVDSGIITKGEAFDYEKDLNNDVDNYAEEFTKQEKDAEKATVFQLYDDFVPRLADGNLIADEVQQSDLPAEKKKLWVSYMQNSYTDAPKEAGFKEFGRSVSTVIQYSSGALDKATAMEALMDLRYIDQKITDQDFKSAVKRIQSPYPEYVAKNLQVVLENEDMGRFKRKKTMDLSRSLMAWVDDQVKDGKSPSAKEMYQVASQLRVGNNRLVDLGQTVERGGRKYDVVGFDTDGEPLVEPQ